MELRPGRPYLRDGVASPKLAKSAVTPKAEATASDGLRPSVPRASDEARGHLGRRSGGALYSPVDLRPQGYAMWAVEKKSAPGVIFGGGGAHTLDSRVLALLSLGRLGLEVRLIGPLFYWFEVQIDVLEAQMRRAIQADLDVHLFARPNAHRLVLEHLKEFVDVPNRVIVEHRSLAAPR